MVARRHNLVGDDSHRPCQVVLAFANQSVQQADTEVGGASPLKRKYMSGLRCNPGDFIGQVRQLGVREGFAGAHDFQLCRE